MTDVPDNAEATADENRTPALEQDKYEERPETVQLVAKVYDSPQGAGEALEFVEDLHRRKVLRIRNAAVLVKDQDGNVSVTDTKDLDPGKSRVVGAITGGLIGLLAGPVGAVVGVLAGLGAGNLASKWIDRGFSNEWLDGLQENLKPDTSALVVVVEDHWLHSLSEVMAEDEGVFLRQTLTDELAEELMTASEEQE